MVSVNPIPNRKVAKVLNLVLNFQLTHYTVRCFQSHWRMSGSFHLTIKRALQREGEREGGSSKFQMNVYIFYCISEWTKHMAG